jgi:16S rRNA (guanine527-N7)-methyltransferase
MIDQIRSWLRDHGFEPSHAEPICVWLEQVRLWNAKIDLTAARTNEDLLELALLDASMIALHLLADNDEGARIIDVGSGFGAPGMAVAILLPHARVTLVESLRKRCAFLRNVVAMLHFTNRVRVVEDRVENVREAFDVAISRATLPPVDWLACGARLAPCGTCYVLVAKEPLPSDPRCELFFERLYETHQNASRKVGAYRMKVPK